MTTTLLRELGALLRMTPASAQAEHPGNRTVLDLFSRTLAELALLAHDLAEQTAPPDEPVRAPGPGGAVIAPWQGGVFEAEGEYWTVVWEGTVRRIRDMRGLHHIAQLLREPGREFHVLDLASTAGRWANRPPETCGLEVLDASAKSAYRQRLRDLHGELAEAEQLGDLGRAGRIRVERDALMDQLTTALGLGGRDRRTADATERARSTVTQAIRKAIKHIHAALPGLGDELRLHIRTGAHCVYLPDPEHPTTWLV